MQPILNFYQQLKQALFVRDVYAPMFFCDFINMTIVIGFYSQFGVSSSSELVIRHAVLLLLLLLFVCSSVESSLFVPVDYETKGNSQSQGSIDIEHKNLTLTQGKGPTRFYALDFSRVHLDRSKTTIECVFVCL
jgi:hypothetical protein